jgi:hypothetical protein
MKFIGDWINDKREGFGFMLWSNGDYYEGDFINN